MQAKNTTFQEIINGNKQFLIPVFQRDYKWREQNWEQLWNDIATSRDKTEGHFVGSFVQVPSSTFAALPSYLVIDGQQRLATLVVLCCALRDHNDETGLQGVMVVRLEMT